ncbi:hypothetical protein [Dactylosporangium sp. NPDC048998]|uniref:hypothetical protein n=1 Tax=Dactylosporangium sp. NPDC048998 TaxID=3363976 RepID=UPI00371246C4
MTIIAGHAFIQNLRRGHYELGLDQPAEHRLVVHPPAAIDAMIAQLHTTVLGGGAA